MSDYYQQQVTLYMMRRAKRQADDQIMAATDESPEASSHIGGWLARLGSLLPNAPAQRSVSRPIPGPSGKVESA